MTAVPDNAIRSLPNPTQSVAKLLATTLPTVSTNHLLSTGLKFKRTLSNYSTSQIVTLPLPSLLFLEEAAEDYAEAIDQGAKSFQYVIDGDTTLLPIWAIRYWEVVERTRTAQTAWRSAFLWLQNTLPVDVGDLEKSRVLEIQQTCSALMQVLPWDENRLFSWHAQPDEIGGSIQLASLLSDDWLGSDTVDRMLQSVATRAGSSDKLQRDVFVASRQLAENILKAYEKGLAGKRAGRAVAEFAERVQNASFRRCFFVENVRGSHWIVLEVDLEEHTICSADSLSSLGHSRRLERALRSWLKETTGDEFTVGERFRVPQQLDEYSCGICSVAFIAHRMFGDDLWAQSNRRLLRAEQFITAARLFIAQPPQSPHLTIPGVYLFDLKIWDDPEISCQDKKGQQRSGTLVDIKAGLTTEGKRKENKMSPPESDTAAPKASGSKIASSNPSASFESSKSPPVPIVSTTSSPAPSHAASSSVPSSSRLHAAQDIGVDQRPADPERPPKKRASNPLDILSHAPAKKMKAEYKKVQRDPSKDDGAGPVGISRTSQHRKDIREQIRTGKFVLNEAKWLNFVEKIHEIDEEAVMDRARVQEVQCSVCNEWFMMGDVYEIANFVKHHPDCRLKRDRRLKKQPTLFSMGAVKKLPPAPVVNAPAKVERRCRGIQGDADDEISAYLGRVCTSAAGGKSLQALTKQEFGEKAKYGDLHADDKKDIEELRKDSMQWTVDQTNRAVYSTKCLRQVMTPAEEPSATSRLPCHECASLRRNHDFQIALNRKGSSNPANAKYTNKKYLDPRMTELFLKIKGLKELLEPTSRKNDGFSPVLRFAAGVANGTIKKSSAVTLFSGLSQAMAIGSLYEAKDMKMNGMRYSPEVKAICRALFARSPSAYMLLYGPLHLPVPRYLRHINASEPKFPLDLGPEVFERAKKFLERIGAEHAYCALAVDDTKLNAAIQSYWDPRAERWVLLGSADGPVLVKDDLEVEAKVNDPNLVKATKVRLFTLTVALPGVSPLALAAVALPPGKTNAPMLLTMTSTVYYGLRKVGVKVVSLSADGTAVERTVQKLMMNERTDTRTYQFKHPLELHDPLEIQINLFDGEPLIQCQDIKHFAKTCRNNQFSGCRELVLGDHDVAYYQPFDIVHRGKLPTGEEQPMFHRDVVNPDRMDDNAANRIQSSALVNYLGMLGDPYPLFLRLNVVCGELVDSCLSRTISHMERAIMAWRAHFFIGNWKDFLVSAKYPLHKHFLSYQCLDIYRIIVNQILALIVTYRDYGDGQPLLPWLHSTEPVEHFFGEARKIVREFTMLDFVQIGTKVYGRMNPFDDLAPSVQASKARAAGYNTTSFLKQLDIDLIQLTTFPDDEALEAAAKIGFAEAAALCKDLGYSISDSFVPIGPSVVHLPSIDEWYPRGVDHGKFEEEDASEDEEADEETESEGESDEDVAKMSDAQVLSKAQALERRIAAAASAQEGGLSHGDTTAQSGILGVVAMDYDRNEYIASLEEEETSFPRVREWIGDILADALPPLRDSTYGDTLATRLAPLADPEPHLLASNSADVSVERLVALRRAHETHEKKFGVRTKTLPPPSEKQLAHRLMTVRINKMLRMHAGPSQISGNLRSERVKEPLTGNSANAAIVRATKDSKDLRKRIALYQALKVPEVDKYAREASTSLVSPIRQGTHVICYDSQTRKLCVATVITMYSKAAGKGSAHAFIESCSIITHASYFALQLYSNETITGSTSSFYTRSAVIASQTRHIRRYAFVPSCAIICTLGGLRPDTDLVGRPLLRATGSVNAIIVLMYRNQARIIEVVKELLKKPRKEPIGGIETEDEDDEDRAGLGDL